MRIHGNCFQQLAIAIFTTTAFYAISANAQIVPDTTLPNNSRITIQDDIKIIEGGSQAGSNLFHSFEQFSVPSNTTAHFKNTANIQNIITRITGNSISNINGTLRANGTANLFLMNPNGIIFGENAALDIGGSFLATTASRINLADGTIFSATQPETTPLLTVNVPIGLQFGATAAPIRNQSQASPNGATTLYNLPVGLQVPTGKTLALIGGDITLDGGNLTVDSGQIQLGSVAANSLVNLEEIDRGWVFGYEAVENFQNIQLISRSVNGSEISSNVYASNQFGNASIQIQGNLIELIGNNFVTLLNTGEDIVDSGNLTINARKLIVRDGTQINNITFSNNAAGNLTVNAFESIEIIGGFSISKNRVIPSALITATGAIGKAGDLTINTNRLLIKDGGVISASSSGFQSLTATGEGGNVIVNASDSVELIGRTRSFPSSLFANTEGSANAGNLSISTKRLIVRDEAEISVSSQFSELTSTLAVVGDTTNLGDAGELNIIADSILLENQGKLISQTDSGNGGNINLQLKDFLLMRRNSQISTNAGRAELDGDGGNINIDVPNGFIVAVPDENSDITANAFKDSGGRVDINAVGIFGIQPRSRDELTELLATNNPSELNPENLLTSDITAISQQNPNLNGQLNINARDREPTSELVEIPEIPLDTRVSQVCQPNRDGTQNEFIYTSRGGSPPLPGEVIRSHSPLDVDWVELGEMGRQGQKRKIFNPKPKIPNQIVEATGWVVDKNGDIYFVAEKSSQSGDSFQDAGC